MSAGIYVFNQYYFDLLKKLKQCAKKLKDRSAVAKQVSISIKKHYATFDKMSNDHLEYILENIPDTFWTKLIRLENVDGEKDDDDKVKEEDNKKEEKKEEKKEDNKKEDEKEEEKKEDNKKEDEKEEEKKEDNKKEDEKEEEKKEDNKEEDEKEEEKKEDNKKEDEKEEEKKEDNKEEKKEEDDDPVVNLKSWAKENQKVLLFRDISLISVMKIVKEDAVVHQYLLTLSIFKDPELSDEDVKNIVEKLKGIDDDIQTPDRHEKIIKMIMNSQMKSTGGFTMDDIKGTQIGDLANDIMNDLDLDKIKENVKKEGDVFKALSDSENGIGNILGSVSQKMASKISSGELKQDKLIQEALGLAGKMPQFGGNSEGGGGGTPDIANIMKMMNSMMGQGGMPNMGGMNMPSSRKVKRMMKKKGGNT